METSRLQKKVGKVFRGSFGETSPESRFTDIDNELTELKEAKTKSHKEEEYGDVLASLFQYGNEQNFDVEKVVERTLAKIKKRVGENFYKIEEVGTVFPVTDDPSDEVVATAIKKPKIFDDGYVVEGDGTEGIGVGKNAVRSNKAAVKSGKNLSTVEDFDDDYEIVADIDTKKRG